MVADWKWGKNARERSTRRSCIKASKGTFDSPKFWPVFFICWFLPSFISDPCRLFEVKIKGACAAWVLAANAASPAARFSKSPNFSRTTRSSRSSQPFSACKEISCAKKCPNPFSRNSSRLTLCRHLLLRSRFENQHLARGRRKKRTCKASSWRFFCWPSASRPRTCCRSSPASFRREFRSSTCLA